MQTLAALLLLLLLAIPALRFAAAGCWRGVTTLAATAQAAVWATASAITAARVLHHIMFEAVRTAACPAQAAAATAAAARFGAVHTYQANRLPECRAGVKPAPALHENAVPQLGTTPAAAAVTTAAAAAAACGAAQAHDSSVQLIWAH
jgi:hypothetical protein